MYNPHTTLDILDNDPRMAPRSADALLFAASVSPKDSGVVYCPSLATSSKVRRPLAYSFGTLDTRKKNALLSKTATPAGVGPNTYFPNHDILAQHRNVNNQGFSKGPRKLHSVDRARFWDSGPAYSALGKQVASQQRTEAVPRMAKATKDNPFVGFVDHRLIRVSLPHAVY